MTDLPFHESYPQISVKQSKILPAVQRHLSTVWLILRDCRNGLRGAGIPVSKACEMIYVEPYQGNGRGERTAPNRL